MKIKRYIKEFANDIKKEEKYLKGISEKVDKVLMYKSKGMITDLEAMEMLVRIRKEYQGKHIEEM